ncbi:hypothetical protein [Kutzneria sp. CA-103260]|uniref:hypothetical protein n=1 Tax=Kutzneria sp. CA-103260 TaxID=2802641 RepID=UPI001BA5105E|nr:hypothetical protein [Kutzneria sp. CA-103260]QUQ68388.1 hypothetical protein JJ691_61330 [Kutzneria sp. CA-103260]
MNKPVKPQDVLADGQEYAEFDGVSVRKGSVAAFIGNVHALAEVEADGPQWVEIVAQLRELKPALIRIGVLDVFEIRDPKLRELVDSL